MQIDGRVLAYKMQEPGFYPQVRADVHVQVHAHARMHMHAQRIQCLWLWDEVWDSAILTNSQVILSQLECDMAPHRLMGLNICPLFPHGPVLRSCRTFKGETSGISKFLGVGSYGLQASSISKLLTSRSTEM